MGSLSLGLPRGRSAFASECGSVPRFGLRESGPARHICAHLRTSAWRRASTKKQTRYWAHDSFLFRLIRLRCCEDAEKWVRYYMGCICRGGTYPNSNSSETEPQTLRLSEAAHQEEAVASFVNYCIPSQVLYERLRSSTSNRTDFYPLINDHQGHHLGVCSGSEYCRLYRSPA